MIEGYMQQVVVINSKLLKRDKRLEFISQFKLFLVLFIILQLGYLVMTNQLQLILQSLGLTIVLLVVLIIISYVYYGLFKTNQIIIQSLEEHDLITYKNKQLTINSSDEVSIGYHSGKGSRMVIEFKVLNVATNTSEKLTIFCLDSTAVKHQLREHF